MEIRILASLLRVYRVLQNLWKLFVQGYADIKTKARSQKIILPLSRLEVTHASFSLLLMRFS